MTSTASRDLGAAPGSVDDSTLRSSTETKGPAGKGRVFWKAMLIGVALLIPVEVGLRLVEDRVTHDYGWYVRHADEKVGQMEDFGDADVVFIGASGTNRGVDPTLVDAALGDGTRSYNAALGGSPPTVLAQWAEDVVFDSVTPELALMDMNLRFATPSSDSELDNYLESLGRQSHLGIASAADEAEYFLYEHSALVRLRDEVRNPLTFANEVRIDAGADFAFEGFFTDEGHHLLGRDDVYRFREGEARSQLAFYEDRTFSAAQLDAIDTFVDVSEARGVTPVIVLLPANFEDLYELDPSFEDFVEDFDAEVRERACDRGVVVIEPLEGLGDDQFADLLHLNNAGIPDYAEYLAGEIEAIRAGDAEPPCV